VGPVEGEAVDLRRARQVRADEQAPPVGRDDRRDVDAATARRLRRERPRELARFLPLTIVSVLVGLPEAGRERMLEWSAASFDVLGVDNLRARERYIKTILCLPCITPRNPHGLQIILPYFFSDTPLGSIFGPPRLLTITRRSIRPLRTCLATPKHTQTERALATLVPPPSRSSTMRALKAL
jgi:hypothetical protein